MIDRQSLLAQLMMGPPQPATRLSQLTRGDAIDTMRQSLPPMATPDTRAGRPNRLAELTMPSPEFEPAVRPFGSPHVPAVTTPSEERRLLDLAMMLAPMVGSIRGPSMSTYVTAPGWSRGGGQIEVLRNPKATDAGKMIREHGPLRAVRDANTGDVYVWPGEAALHHDVIQQLGRYSSMLDDAGVIYSPRDLRALK